MSDEEREFIGFFWGEGCLSIHRANMKTFKGIRSNYEPVIQIASRADELPILQWCREKFGGTIYQYKQRTINGYKGKQYLQNPVAIWRIQNREGCYRIIAILEQGKLPALKMRQVSIFKAFLDMKARGKRHGYQGQWFNEEQIAEHEKMKQLLSSSKIFS